MYSIKTPKLVTDQKKGWPFYAMQMTGYYIIKDFFLISNYRRCIEYSSNYYEHNLKFMEFIESTKKEKVPHKDIILANAKELSNWTEEMKSEDYHELYLHSFIGIWSSFEAGLENCFSDFIENDYNSAKTIVSQFTYGKYNLDEWPWNKNICFDIASKLELRAKQVIDNSGIDYFERLKTIFSWLNIKIEIDTIYKYNLNEANRVRNIILHRNGQIDSKDAIDFPSLKEWENNVMPFTEERFKKYYNAIIQTLVSINTGTIEKVKEEDLISGFTQQ